MPSSSYPPRPPISSLSANNSRPGTANTGISSISSSGPGSQQQQQQFSLWRGGSMSASSADALHHRNSSRVSSASSTSALPPRRPATSSSSSEQQPQQQRMSSSAGNSSGAQYLRSTQPSFATNTQSRRQKLGGGSASSARVIGTDTDLDELFSSHGNNNNQNQQQQQQQQNRPSTTDNHHNNNNNNNNASSLVQTGSQQSFRSPAVGIQVALHEIAANVVPRGKIPDSKRARKLLELLRNTGTLCTDSIMSHVLHVLSLELHRCVFGPSHTSIQKYADNLLSAAGSGSGGQPVNDPVEEDDDVAYFEQLEEVSREHRLLLAELNAVENTNRQDQMAAELEKFKQVVPFYEHEIGRLNRESSKKGEETEGLRDELNMLQRIHDRSINDFEVQNKLLLKDVRELQVRLFQVSKNAIETEAGEEMYQMLKTTKSEQLHGLFEQCNERATVSLFMIQIEFLLNTVISRHESSLLNSNARRWPQLVANFRINNTESLLEEYNHLADRREQLDLLEKVEYSDNVKATSGPASSDCTMRKNKNKNSSLKQQQQQQLTSSKERAAKMFGERLAPPTGDGSFESKLRANLHFGPNIQAFHRNAVQPLLDLTATKRFRTNIEVHTESHNGDEALLKTVLTVNPLQTMKVPPKTNLVKLKFLNPMLKNPARNFGDDDRDLLVEETIKSGANVMDWIPDNSEFEEDDNNDNNNDYLGGTTRTKSFKSTNTNSSSKNPTNIANNSARIGSPARTRKSISGASSPLGSPRSLRGFPTAFETSLATTIHQQQQGGNGSIWDEFRHRFGSYHPAMPRRLRVDLCDLHMCRAFLMLRQNIFKKFKVQVDLALKSGAETLDSAIYVALNEARDSYSHRALQSALLESLEELYIYPELIMKVGYELLTAMETFIQTGKAPHLDIYIQALTGRVNPFYAHFIAVVNFKLGANWPQPTLREDDKAGAIPANDVLALFSMIFPNSDTELFRTDAIPPVEPFLEQYLGGVVADEKQTLATVRRFMNQMIAEQSDPWSLKINEAVTFHAEESQWGQLDGEGVYKAVKNLLAHSSTNISAKQRMTGVDPASSPGGGGDGSLRGNNNQSSSDNNNTKNNKKSAIHFGDGTDLKNQMLLHHIWTCAERGTENRLPLEECTRIVTEMVAVATHCSSIEMPEVEMY